MYVILAITGTDPTQDGNTARVRMFVNDEVVDQDFDVPALEGADPSLAPTNFVDQYKAAIDAEVQSTINSLEQS